MVPEGLRLDRLPDGGLRHAQRGGRRALVLLCLATALPAVRSPAVGLLLLLAALPAVDAVRPPVLHLAQRVRRRQALGEVGLVHHGQQDGLAVRRHLRVDRRVELAAQDLGGDDGLRAGERGLALAGLLAGHGCACGAMRAGARRRTAEAAAKRTLSA